MKQLPISMWRLSGEDKSSKTNKGTISSTMPHQNIHHQEGINMQKIWASAHTGPASALHSAHSRISPSELSPSGIRAKSSWLTCCYDRISNLWNTPSARALAVCAPSLGQALTYHVCCISSANLDTKRKTTPVSAYLQHELQNVSPLPVWLEASELIYSLWSVMERFIDDIQGGELHQIASGSHRGCYKDPWLIDVVSVVQNKLRRIRGSIYRTSNPGPLTTVIKRSMTGRWWMVFLTHSKGIRQSFITPHILCVGPSQGTCNLG